MRIISGIRSGDGNIASTLRIHLVFYDRSFLAVACQNNGCIRNQGIIGIANLEQSRRSYILRIYRIRSITDVVDVGSKFTDGLCIDIQHLIIVRGEDGNRLM